MNCLGENFRYNGTLLKILVEKPPLGVDIKIVEDTIWRGIIEPCKVQRRLNERLSR